MRRSSLATPYVRVFLGKSCEQPHGQRKGKTKRRANGKVSCPVRGRGQHSRNDSSVMPQFMDLEDTAILRAHDRITQAFRFGTHTTEPAPAMTPLLCRPLMRTPPSRPVELASYPRAAIRFEAALISIPFTYEEVRKYFDRPGRWPDFLPQTWLLGSHMGTRKRVFYLSPWGHKCFNKDMVQRILESKQRQRRRGRSRKADIFSSRQLSHEHMPKKKSRTVATVDEATRRTAAQQSELYLSHWRPRRIIIAKKYLGSYGFTEGCSMCRALQDGDDSFVPRAHNKECRERIEARLRADPDPELAGRIQRADHRHDERVACQIEMGDAQIVSI